MPTHLPSAVLPPALHPVISELGARALRGSFAPPGRPGRRPGTRPTPCATACCRPSGQAADGHDGRAEAGAGQLDASAGPGAVDLTNLALGHLAEVAVVGVLENVGPERA